MDGFLSQVFGLLTSEAGSLTYQLVLAFSIAGALQAVIQGSGMSQGVGKRMVYGLSLLLLIRLALFMVGGLTWQGLNPSSALLPAIDRAATLAGLVVLVWLWVFPDAGRAADSAAVLLGLLAEAVFALSAAWAFRQGLPPFFNASLPDMVASILSLALISIGAALLIIRKPEVWGTGLAMMLVMGAGFILHILFPNLESDYAGMVRLTQMAAYPLLFALPGRLQPALAPAPAMDESRPAPVEKRPALDPALLAGWFDFALAPDAETRQRKLLLQLAWQMKADLILLVMPPDEGGHIRLTEVYDHIREQYLPGGMLDSRRCPVLASSLRRGRPLMMQSDSSSSDMTALASALSLEHAGNLLFTPFLNPAGAVSFGVILLTPHSGRAWTSTDQAFLSELTSVLAQPLQRKEPEPAKDAKDDMLLKDTQLAESRQLTQQIQEKYDLLKGEQGRVAAQLEQARQERDKDRSRLDELAIAAAAAAAYQLKVHQLQDEITLLQQALEERSQAPASAPAAAPAAEQELRLALEEIASLRDELREAEQQIGTLKAAAVASAGAAVAATAAAVNASSASETPLPAPSLNGADLRSRMEQAQALTREVHQPLSSTVGYIDFLLGESVGILGALQRKFLERIKVSTDRMNRMLDEIIEILELDPNRAVVEARSLDVHAVIHEALAITAAQMREKKVALVLEIPERLPGLQADPDAMQQILVQLLFNAGTATPPGGRVTISARIEAGSNSPDYVLLQVMDEGPGIPPTELTRVFYRTQGESRIPGLGDNAAELAQVKSMVDAMNGRIWVDSVVGKGATFSVLLPVPQIISSLDEASG